MADEPDLHPNEATGEWVTYLQGTLRSLGFDVGSDDGTFGDTTSQAVQSFQQANNCTVDGWVGQQTWAAINALLGGGQSGGSGDVPADIVALGFPASTEHWSSEQHESYHKGLERDEQTQSGDAESFEVAAIQDSDSEGTMA